MALEFRLPDVGEGIASGELVEWHVAEGQDVREDEPMADVQTDKAIVVIPCPTTGKVLELRAQEGDTVPVGEVLAVFAPADEGTGAAPVLAVEAPSASPAPRRALASPAVRKLARERGVALAELAGSGPGGRILREDVTAEAGNGASGPAPPVAVPPALSPPRGDDEVVPLRGVRRVIARTLTHAWQTVPHVTDYREVDATGLAAARRALKRHAERADDAELAAAMTMTPLLVKIAAHALGHHPYVNASVDLEREEITLRAGRHVGVATAAPQGLVVPVVHDADAKSLDEVAREVAALTVAARENRLTVAQQSGGTFTVNNYGALGVWLGTPIVRPPEVANLGVGRMADRPVAVNGQVVVKPIIPLAVAADHRILDGDTLAAFVNEVVELMEDPVLLFARAR